MKRLLHVLLCKQVFLLTSSHVFFGTFFETTGSPIWEWNITEFTAIPLQELNQDSLFAQWYLQIVLHKKISQGLTEKHVIPITSDGMGDYDKEKEEKRDLE